MIDAMKPPKTSAHPDRYTIYPASSEKKGLFLMIPTEPSWYETHFGKTAAFVRVPLVLFCIGLVMNSPKTHLLRDRSEASLETMQISRSKIGKT